MLTLLPCVTSVYAQPHGAANVRYVAVEIKNGPVLYGELIERDSKSISIKSADGGCGVKIDLRDVARVFDVDKPADVSGESSGAKHATKMSRDAWLSLGARGRP